MRDPPEQGPDWFFVVTKACGSGTPDPGLFLGVSVFIVIFGIGLTSRGSLSRPRGWRARPTPWLALLSRGWLGTLLAQLFYSRGFFWSIKNHQKLARPLDSVWYSFCVKLKNKEKTETGTRL